jgi:hypothetical protein
MGGGGRGGNIYRYKLTAFNRADLTDLRKIRCDGLYFKTLALFQFFGKVNKGNLFVVAK